MLGEVYPDGEIPISHIIELKEQIEKQTKTYRITEEDVEVALALINPKDLTKKKLTEKQYTQQKLYITKIRKISY